MKKSLAAVFLLCLSLTGCQWMYYDVSTSQLKVRETDRTARMEDLTPQQILDAQNISSDNRAFKFVEWDEVPVFSRGEEEKLDAYLLERFLAGDEQAAFLRKGCTGDITVSSLYAVGGFREVNTTWYTVAVNGENVDYVLMHLVHSPGRRILKAYETGNLDDLTEEETIVFHMALNFVKNVFKPQDTPLQRERRIHDHICAVTEYYDEKELPEFSPFQSAIGVFLNGKANCMGYADAFYLLCGMADVPAESVSCQALDHSWNLVELEGAWYLVDVTWDDNFGEVPTYVCFNAGMDVAQELYAFPAGDPTHKIVSVSDEKYPYYGGGEAFFAFENEISIDLIARKMTSGVSPVYVLTKGNVPAADDIHDGILKYMEDADVQADGEFVTEIMETENLCFLTIRFTGEIVP